MTTAEIYSQAIQNGCTPRLADLLASRKPPGLKGSERAFLEGTGTAPITGVSDWMATEMIAEAKLAGIVTSGRVDRKSTRLNSSH